MEKRNIVGENDLDTVSGGSGEMRAYILLTSTCRFSGEDAKRICALLSNGANEIDLMHLYHMDRSMAEQVCAVYHRETGL